MIKRSNWFAIKVEVYDLAASRYDFRAQKTMYGGKHIAVGDIVFIFASENEGGAGLFARGIVSHAEANPRTAARRQTPRVTIQVQRDGSTRRPFGRSQVREFRGKSIDRPEAEIDFKLYRQATNKIVGLSDATGEFLNELF